MFNRLFLCLALASTLMIGGCFIEGKIVDESGKGVAGVTVTLNGGGGQSRMTTTDRDGKYMFGDLMNDDIISAGSYTVIPSKSGYNFTPAGKNITITTKTLGDLENAPWPVTGVGFEADSAAIPDSATVALPEGIGHASVSIQTAAGEFKPDESGAFVVRDIPASGPYFVTATSGDVLVAISLFEPDKKENRVSCLETAVSLVMLNTPLLMLPSHVMEDVLSSVRTAPEVQTLSEMICAGLDQRIDILVKPDDPLIEALRNAATAVLGSLALLVAPENL